MRQAAPNLQRKIPFKPILVGLIFLLLVISTFMLLVRKEEQRAARTTLEEVRERAEAAAAHNVYGLAIEESGPGYLICFKGQMVGNCLYGKIDNFDLDICSEYDRYFIKAKGDEDWQPLTQTGLDDLPALIRNPHDLLQTILKGKEIVAEEGVQRNLNNIQCQTYFLEIPPPDLQLLTRFENNATLDKLQIYLWFAAENNFLYRMAILMNMTIEEETIQVNRIYDLTPECEDLPEGLPFNKGKKSPV
ncbi:MAG: hypothetical protein GX893_02480 [Firmicutes bacterium]|mgnify:CR=1 FL=1|nr:hypothetical protein [Bacillota bacterium]